MNIHHLMVDIHTVVWYILNMIRYVERVMSSQLKDAAASFPIVVLTGPRQTGESTLLQKIFPYSSHF